MPLLSLLLAFSFGCAPAHGQAIVPHSGMRVDVTSAAVTGISCIRRPFKMEFCQGLGRQYKRTSRQSFGKDPDPRAMAIGLFSFVLMTPIAILTPPADLISAPWRRECQFTARLRGRLKGWAGQDTGGSALGLESYSLLDPGVEGVARPVYRVERTSGTADAEGNFDLSVAGQVGRSSQTLLRWSVDAKPAGSMSLAKHGREFELSEPEPEFGGSMETIEPIMIKPQSGGKP